eukprot:PhF_6_TR5582/c1_g2_i10/m.8005
MPECPICQQVSLQPVQLKCMHVFCLPCISDWRSMQPNCPICRLPIAPQDGTKVNNDLVKIEECKNRLNHVEILEDVSKLTLSDIPLGEGGCGVIHAGTFRGEPVAVKVFTFRDSKLLSNLRRELTFYSRILHPNIVQLKAVCTEEHCKAYVVMEKGEQDLISLLQRFQPNGLPLSEWVQLGIDIFCALYAQQRASCVHGDIKPGNILVFPRLHGGHAQGTHLFKLCDFNTANFRDATVTSSLTQLTVAYAAPEKFGDNATTPLSEHDVYSTAMTLLEALTGTPPYNNLSAMQILNKKSQPHPIPPTVPSHLTKFFQDNLGPAEGRWSVSDCLQFFLGLQCGSTKLSLPSHTLAPVKNVETTYSAVLKAMGPLCLRGRRVCVTGIVEIKNPELQRNFDRHHGLITQMLHGTDSYHTISSEGFVVQERKNSQGQYLRKHSDDPLLFGSGVYLTPVFYKASNFTATDAVILCDVKLGTCVDKDEPYETCDLSVAKAKGFDSIRATHGCSDESLVGLEEVIVYDPTRVLPRYVIYFQTIHQRTLEYYVSLADGFRKPLPRISAADLATYVAVIDAHRSTVTSPAQLCPAVLISCFSFIGDYLSSNVNDDIFSWMGDVTLPIIQEAFEQSNTNQVLVWHMLRIISNYCRTQPQEQSRRTQVLSCVSLTSNILKLARHHISNEAVAQQALCALGNLYCGMEVPTDVAALASDCLSDSMEEDATIAMACNVYRNAIAHNDKYVVWKEKEKTARVCKVMKKSCGLIPWWLAAFTTVLYEKPKSERVGTFESFVTSEDCLHQIFKYKDQELWKYFWWATVATDAVVEKILSTDDLDDFFPMTVLRQLDNPNPSFVERAIRRAKLSTETSYKKIVWDVLEKVKDKSIPLKYMTKEEYDLWGTYTTGTGNVVSESVPS